MPALAFRVLVLLGTFVALDFLVLGGSRLWGNEFEAPVLTLALAHRVLSEPMSVPLAGALVFLAWRSRSSLKTWSKFEHGVPIRAFIVAVSAITAWRSATNDYNLFLDQGHYLDRILVIVLVPLIYWRPIFVLPFVFLVAALFWQFAYPLESHSWAQQFLPVRILTLFFAALLLTGLTGRSTTKDLVFLVCCMVASHYWIPGLGKLQLFWPLHEQIGNLIPATYANGWLSFLDAEDIPSYSRTVALFNPLIVAAALLFQSSSPFVLWSRGFLIAFLGVATCFHLAVFSLSGILFWQWILIDIAFLVLLARLWPDKSFPICTWRHFLLGILVIGGAGFWFKPVKLAWYDVPVSYTYRFEAMDSGGRRYSLPPQFFSPFDFQMTLSAFGYLVDRPVLGITWGATTDSALADALAASPTREQVFELEKRRGRIQYDSDRAARFNDFVERFVSSFNRRGSNGTWLTPVKAPRKVWTFEREAGYDGAAPIVEVEVYRVTSLFNENGYSEIHKTLVRRISVPQE